MDVVENTPRAAAEPCAVEWSQSLPFQCSDSMMCARRQQSTVRSTGMSKRSVQPAMHSKNNQLRDLFSNMTASLTIRHGRKESRVWGWPPRKVKEVGTYRLQSLNFLLELEGSIFVVGAQCSTIGEAISRRGRSLIRLSSVSRAAKISGKPTTLNLDNGMNSWRFKRYPTVISAS